MAQSNKPTDEKKVQTMPLPEQKKGNKLWYGIGAVLLIVLVVSLLYLIRSWYQTAENPGQDNPTPTSEITPSPLPQVSVAITTYETIPSEFIQNIPSPETVTLGGVILTQSYGVIEKITENGLEVLVSVSPPNNFERVSLEYKGETRWAVADFAYSEGVFVYLAKEYIKYDDFLNLANTGEYVRILYESDLETNTAQEVVLLQD